MLDKFFEETPFFTAEHVSIAKAIESFTAQEIEPRSGETEDVDSQFRGLLQLLANADILRYAIASPGGVLDSRTLCLVREALSYSSPLADSAFVMQGLSTFAISIGTDEHVRDFWLKRAREGAFIGAFAITEEEAGSDVAAMKSTATLDGDSYVLNGRKRFISNAGLADFYTAFAKTGTRSNGKPEISCFIVGARMPGFEVRSRTELLAPHPMGEIEFKSLRLPSQNMVGETGDGFLLAMQTLDAFRPSVGAAACGMARRALDEAIRHSKTRHQFGHPLSDFQVIQGKLADMATELDASRLLVYRAAYLRDMGKVHTTLEASEAKLFATESAQRIVDNALQIHGGAGLIRGSILERLYRDVRALRIYEGTSEIQRLVIASRLLG